jgi:hypothetical protein
VFKLGTLVDGNDVPAFYDGVWCLEHTTGSDRLVIAPRSDHVRLMLELASLWRSPIFILYVLVVPRGSHAAARYQAPAPVSLDEARALLERFETFLTEDGRHHLWLAAPEGGGTLVYDRHNVIYAYGPIDAYESVLAAQGLRNGEVRFPVPHSHHYHPEHDAEEDELLAYWNWRSSPLQAQDEA